MKKNRLIALSAAAVLSATAIVGGTLAYFTDTDAATNTFVVGNVEIRLDEKDKEGNPFKNHQVLVPTKANEDQVNYIDKIVTVANTGSEDAYIWVEMLVPAAIDDIDSEDDSLHLVSSEDVKIVPMGTENLAGRDYNRYVYYFDGEPVKSGDSTAAFLDAVYMDHRVTQSKTTRGYNLVNGTEDYSGEWEVAVKAFAIQADGFTTAEEAMNGYYGIDSLQ